MEHVLEDLGPEAAADGPGYDLEAVTALDAAARRAGGIWVEEASRESDAMMDPIASIPVLGPVLLTVLPFIVALGIVVFVHEFGHYIVARWCGIRSEVFSIGFGPVIWSRRDRRGTVWQVAALPLGGYVKFLGDADGASRADPEEPGADERRRSARHSFPGASVWPPDADGARRARCSTSC